MKRFPVVFVLIFCLGIVTASIISIPFFLAYSLTVIFLALSFLSIKNNLKFGIFIFCLIFSLGIVCLRNSQTLAKCHIRKYASYKNNYIYTVRGFINNEPELKNNLIFFIFRVEDIQLNNLKFNCCGDILVYTKGRKDLHYGEELILSGNLYQPYRFGYTGRKGYRDYLSNRGIYSIMNVKAHHCVVRLNRNKGLAIKRFALSLKHKIENIIFKYVSFPPASILDAMILGERRDIPVSIYNSMIKSGTVHILVVSGFNVTLVFFIIILFLRLIRLKRKMRIYVAIPLLILYCLITGASNPVVRATIMAVVFLSSYLFKREPDIYNSSALAALFILWINPRQLFDIGFQLSFMSVLSIVSFYPRIRGFLHTGSIKIRYIKFLLDGCLVSLSAWLGTMGFIAYYFKIFSPVTVLANIFIVPLATLITLCGFSLIIIGIICPVLAPFFAWTDTILVTLLLNINSSLIKIPGAYYLLSR